jgi:methylenetetrahydrofolate reductase (NADPH)
VCGAEVSLHKYRHPASPTQANYRNALEEPNQERVTAAANNCSVRIDCLLKTAWPTFSFEFMAPRSDAEHDAISCVAEELRDLEPAFICVTCRSRRHGETLNLVQRIQRQTGVSTMAHLICEGTSRREVGEFLRELKRTAVGNVLALRGDPGTESHKNELRHASELIEIIASDGGLCIGAACYPEGHVESPNRDADLRYTKLKVEQGATFLITQLFFDNRHYFEFVKSARAYGVDVPIIPGIMPITSARQLPRVKAMGASMPKALEKEVLARANDAQAVAQFGVAWASLQCTNLLAAGAPGIHFYTFNRSAATRAILGALRSAEPWKWSNSDAIA